MGLNVGNAPVKQVYVGSTPVKSVYVGSKLVWSATVQITLGTGYEARDQFRAALTERGLDYQTVKEVPFRIELVGSGSIQEMFRHCSALTTAPAMDTSNVTSMMRLFHSCYALTSVPDMKTSQVTDMSFTFYYCQSLTDGNVRLMGKNPNVYTSNMIVGSSLTKEPWYNADGTPLRPRKVTIATDNVGQWNKNTVIGDTSLIQGWGASDVVRFVTDVTCNKGSYSSDSFMIQNPGTVLRAGADIKPYKIDTYTFTEVL